MLVRLCAAAYAPCNGILVNLIVIDEHSLLIGNEAIRNLLDTLLRRFADAVFGGGISGLGKHIIYGWVRGGRSHLGPVLRRR